MSLIGVLTFILVLAVLVFFHELGHFLFAKLFRMKVEEFAIGFGPRLLRVFHDGETEYNIRALPFGGFVRIKGMEIEDATERRFTGVGEAPVPGSPGRDAAGLTGQFDRAANDSVLNKPLDRIDEPDNAGFQTTNYSTMSQEVAEADDADPDGFNSRPIYQRFWVILGGPLFSFLFGWLVFCLVGATFGVPEDATQTTVIEQVVGGKPAARAGIHSGDTIVSINDKPVSTGEEMVDMIHSLPGQPITLSIRTGNGQTRKVTVTPESVPDPTQPGKTIGLIGVQPAIQYGESKRISLRESFAFGNRNTVLWFQTMGQVLTNIKLFGASVGGPVEILKESNKASKAGGTHIILLIAQLSLSLGLFNLFPIPILDGGHLALMTLEKIRGRKLTAEQTGRVFMVGFIFIATVASFILLRGVYRLFVN